MNGYYGLTHDKVSAYLKAAGWQRYLTDSPTVEDWGTTGAGGVTLHVVLLTDPADESYSEAIREAVVLISDINERRAEMWKDLESRIDMFALLSRN